MSLNNGSSNPSRCSKVECYISSFDVVITPGTNTLTAVITDTCNQVTECRMMKAILSKAISEYLEDEEIDLPDGNCKFNCCDGIYGVNYVVNTLTATLDITGVSSGDPVTYEVTPPFYVVN
jgi:hypothetical protein